MISLLFWPGRLAACALLCVVFSLNGCGGGSSEATPSAGGISPGAGGNTDSAGNPLPDATPISAARLLTQASFGPSEKAIEQVQALGLAQWIDQQFTLKGTPHLDYVLANSNGSSRQARHDIWWRDAITGQDQLRQRVAFALSEIFVVSDVGYTLSNSQYGVTRYYDMLRDNAFGNYRQLLEDITLSPVMGIYLSMLQNARGDPLSNTRPDENFAREVMQLFSIGLHQLNSDGSVVMNQGRPVPAYTQTDVENYARVFTGWNFSEAGRWDRPLFTGASLVNPMVVYPGYHDDQSKALLGGEQTPAGNSANADLTAALDSLHNHPNVGPFLGRQLIQRLVTSNPSAEYITRVAAAFNDNGAGVRGDLAAVVRTILLDPEALYGHDQISSFGKLREPLLRITHLWRAFQVTPGSAATNGQFNTIAPYVENLEFATGQAVLKSASVFNFFHPEYSPLGALYQKQLLAPEAEIYTDNNILATTAHINTLIQRFVAGRDQTISYINLSAEYELASDPPRLLERLSLLLLSGSMTADMQRILTDHIRTFPATDTGRSQAVRDVISLIMASPDYLVQM